MKRALDIPLLHHERWNGSGYPYGLVGEAIPLYARLFAIVDVYDALNSNRPYRDALGEDNTREYIKDRSGIDFDPAIVKVFLEMLNGTEFPYQTPNP